MALEVRVLGDIAVVRDDAPVELGGRRPRALLALLLAEHGRAVATDTIVDRLWPHDPPETAVKTIQVYVSRLRAGLGADRDRIASRAGGYALRIEPDELDAGRFESGLVSARELLAADNAGPALTRVDAALRSWRGRPFGDLADEPFLLPETRRLEDLATEAHEIRATTLVALGRPEEAVGALRRIVAEQPARESAWTRLLLALYAAGRQADALAAYHEVRAYLDEELGVEPGPELQAAHLAVLQQSISLPTRRGAGSAHVSAPALERPTGVVGRDRDVEAVEALFAGGARLVTLTGPGGVGKTTLARELLGRRQATLGGRVVFVELEALRGPDLVPAAVAAALGGDGDAAEQLAGAHVLVGLDNLEHLIGASPWIGDLLRSQSGVRVLATSREPLRLEVERVHPVEPISPDAARELFLQRARRVRPGLEPSPAIAAVCARLDHLPLAIELAAARTSLLSPEALLTRLDRVLDVLGDSARDHADRQRTLRSTIAWSYELLEPEPRRVFRRLAVFVGGFGVEGAEQVAGATLDDLEKLLAQSLVTARYEAEEPRFHLFETIRAFAIERLGHDADASTDLGAEADGLEALRGRHARWAVELVDAANRDGRGNEAGVRELARELDNLRAAMAWARETGDDVTRWRIAVGLSDVWQTRGHLVEARDWLESGLDEADLPDNLRAEALDDASTMAFRQGRLVDARALAERQLALADRLGQHRRMVAALAKLAQIALRSGDAERSRQLHADALAIAGRDTDPRPLMVSLNSLANADLLAGRADRATTAFEEVLRLAEQVGRPETVATTWFNLGLARLLDGRDLAQARATLREALDRYVELDDTEGIGYVLVAVAGLVARTDGETAALALGASAAALTSVDAELEAVEDALRASTLERLASVLGAPALASGTTAGAALSVADRLALARRVLGVPST